MGSRSRPGGPAAIDRRGFFRLAGGALALLGRARPSRAAGPAPGIHTATRNRLLGSVGARRDPGPLERARWKPYPGSPRRVLPAPDAAPGLSLAEALTRAAPARAFAGAPLALPALARLLHLANGATSAVGTGVEQVLLRAAPSAGALYAGEVYVIAERVAGLAPGLYYFSVPERALVALRAGSLEDEVAGALEAPGPGRGAAAWVLLTNVFGRYGWRYANRGYRYALIDTGHIGENLRLAAASAGVAEALALRFHDDALHALLGIDGRREAVCAVHALGAAAAPPEGAPPAPRRLVERQRAAPDSLPDTEHATDRYHEATKLVPRAGPAPPVPPPSAPPAGAVGPALALPEGAAPSMRVERAIARRRSPAAFEPAPMDLADLAFALRAAHGEPALARASGVDLYLIAHRVDGLAAGLYRFEPLGGRLRPLRAEDLSRALVRACRRQRNAGLAAAACFMVGRFAASDSPLGERSYRDQLIESGAIGERLYLAAEALGLAARNLAAFTDDALNDLLGLDGRSEAVLHLTVLGRGA